MNFWSILTGHRQTRLIAQTAQQVAERSHRPVLDRVRRRAATMRIAEARGYVRARALEIVHRELAALDRGQPGRTPDQQVLIVSQATEAVVTGILAELRSVPKAAPRPLERRAA